MSFDFEALAPQLAERCPRYGIAELSVFGSVAPGDDRPDSVVDFLYVGDPAVDGSWPGRWVIRDRVVAEARALYAA